LRLLVTWWKFGLVMDVADKLLWSWRRRRQILGKATDCDVPGRVAVIEFCLIARLCAEH